MGTGIWDYRILFEQLHKEIMENLGYVEMKREDEAY